MNHGDAHEILALCGWFSRAAITLVLLLDEILLSQVLSC